MSLKAVHIIFIAASTMLSIGFGAWCLNRYFGGWGTAVDLWLGSGSICLAVALLCYGRYFLKKLKHVSYL